MTDFLHPQLGAEDLGKLSTLALAHVGDCVFELMTRSYLAIHGAVTAKALHQSTIRLVRADAQAKGAAVILPLLTEEEQAVFRRGRNAKPKFIPKSATPAQYAYATAVEALFGWLFLQGRYDRLNELYQAALPAMQDNR